MSCGLEGDSKLSEAQLIQCLSLPPHAGEHRQKRPVVINRTTSKTLTQVLLLTRPAPQHFKIRKLPNRRKTIQSVFSTLDERNAKTSTRENSK